MFVGNKDSEEKKNKAGKEIGNTGGWELQFLKCVVTFKMRGLGLPWWRSG